MLRLNIAKYHLWSSFGLIGCAYLAVIFIFVDANLQLVQERAEVKFSNPSYISGVSVFTSRRGRGAPYTTNITGTIHQAWGNNVSFKFSYVMKDGNVVDLSGRCCEVMDKPWIIAFSQKLSNVTTCPIASGTYRYYNIEIPPKNFPLTIPKLERGDSFKLHIAIYMTRSKEKIFNMVTTVRAK